MTTTRTILMAILFLLIATLSVQSNKQELSTSEVEIKKVAAKFAASHILGTGADQYLSSISVLTNENAIATIGETDEDEDDPKAYQANLKRIKGSWKIISIEFIFKPTGKKKVEKIEPPFPDPYWDKLIKENQ